jgi:transposase
VGRYAKNSHQMRQVRRAADCAQRSWPDRERPARITPRRVTRRLSESELQDLISAYGDGATGRELAERYGLARSTVIKLLKDRGVAVRHPRVSDAEVHQIVHLYQQGFRQSDIAQRLGRHKSLVWHVLRRAGQSGSPGGSYGTATESTCSVRRRSRLRFPFGHGIG